MRFSPYRAAQGGGSGLNLNRLKQGVSRFRKRLKCRGGGGRRDEVFQLAGERRKRPTYKQPIPMLNRNKEEPLSGTLAIPCTFPPEAILIPWFPPLIISPTTLPGAAANPAFGARTMPSNTDSLFKPPASAALCVPVMLNSTFAGFGPRLR
jgi:hypothetical protein